MTLLISLMLTFCPPPDTLPDVQPPTLTFLSFEALSKSFNTMSEDGSPMRVVSALKVEGQQETPALQLHFPPVTGFDRRNLEFMKWDGAVRRWVRLKGSTLKSSTHRESGGMVVVVSDGDGVYGIFAPLERGLPTQHFTFEGTLNHLEATPTWRLSLHRSGIIVEGWGEASVALPVLPPDATLQVSWPTLYGEVNQSNTLWNWCGQTSRDLVKGKSHFHIRQDLVDSARARIPQKHETVNPPASL